MAFWINITYAAGTFGATVSTLDIFSNYDSYATAVATGIAKATLVSGYSLSVPDGTTIVRVKGTGTCVGSYQDISVTGAPSPAPTPAAPTPAAPTPAAPTPAPAAPTPAPAAPTPASPNYSPVNFGYSTSDGDTACSNYETNNFVTKYPDGSLGNGVTIWNFSNGTGVPNDGWYAFGSNHYYSTSGVLGSQTACYTPPPPAAPTPTPAPAPTPSPVSTSIWWDISLFLSSAAGDTGKCNACGGIDNPAGIYYVYGTQYDFSSSSDLSFNSDGSGKNPPSGYYSDGFHVFYWNSSLGSFTEGPVLCNSLVCQ